MAKSARGAQGAGTIRKKTVTRNGKQYTYWEARVTVGRDSGTGKQIQKSFSGKTQKEVREKMQAAAVDVNNNAYVEPSKLTVGQWLDIWLDEYLGSVKPRTAVLYADTVRLYIKPTLGALKLSSLSTHDIQKLCNDLQKRHKPLSPKTIKNLHGVVHKALQQAVELGYIRINPADACKLPRVEKAKIKPLDNNAIVSFLKVVQGHQYECIYLITLFTGMRESEVLGLTWDCVNFKNGTILINKQLQKVRGSNGKCVFVSPKNNKSRYITPASSVMALLKEQQRNQAEQQSIAGALWNNSLNLVFTNAFGEHIPANTVYLNFKKLIAEAGYPDTRFHDLRHTYAVAALQAGDDIKTVQENLGHHTAAFTLDVYGHVTEKMKLDSAARMEAFIQGVSENKGKNKGKK